MFLKYLEHNFSIVGLTQIWLNENEQDLYDLPDYNRIQWYRKGGEVESVIIFENWYTAF